MASVKKEDFSINTIVGPGTSVSGDIESAGFTRVDGNVMGDLKARGRVIIGERARMKSNVSGTFITIGGVVFGNVLASERLIILSSGLVMGDIITRRIEAEKGCLIHGRVRVCKTEEAWNRALAEYRDTAGLRESLGLHGPSGLHGQGFGNTVRSHG
jgi:cytoskeletal protein CcmA (bactofilin family)